MKKVWKWVRDRTQRALFNQQREVLKVLAWAETYEGDSHVTYKPGEYRWLTYVQVSFHSKGRVSLENALAALDAMSIEQQPDEWLVDRLYKRDGEVGTFFAINDRGRKWLEDN